MAQTVEAKINKQRQCAAQAVELLQRMGGMKHDVTITSYNYTKRMRASEDTTVDDFEEESHETWFWHANDGEHLVRMGANRLFWFFSNAGTRETILCFDENGYAHQCNTASDSFCIAFDYYDKRCDMSDPDKSDEFHVEVEGRLTFYEIFAAYAKWEQDMLRAVALHLYRAEVHKSPLFEPSLLQRIAQRTKAPELPVVSTHLLFDEMKRLRR